MPQRSRYFVHSVRLALVATALLGPLVGCIHRAYPGPERPREEVAVIRPNPRGSSIGIAVERVGDLEVDAVQDPVEVLPGRTTLFLWVMPREPAWGGAHNVFELERRRDNIEQAIPLTITFDAEPGRRYAFTGTFDAMAGRAVVRLVDESSGQAVATEEVTLPPSHDGLPW